MNSTTNELQVCPLCLHLQRLQNDIACLYREQEELRHQNEHLEELIHENAIDIKNVNRRLEGLPQNDWTDEDNDGDE